jgi:hypothetical protein
MRCVPCSRRQVISLLDLLVQKYLLYWYKSRLHALRALQSSRRRMLLQVGILLALQVQNYK